MRFYISLRNHFYTSIRLQSACKMRKFNYRLTSSCFALMSGFHPNLQKGCVVIPKGVGDGLFAIWGGVTALWD